MILNKYDSPLLLMAIMLVNNVQISERSWKMDKETQAYFKEVLLKRLDELY